MTGEKSRAKTISLRALMAAGSAALAFLTASLVSNEPTHTTDTILCNELGLEPNDDGTVTAHTSWVQNPYGPQAKELRFSYTDGQSQEVFYTTGATNEPQRLQLPDGALRIMVDVVDVNDDIASCPSEPVE